MTEGTFPFRQPSFVSVQSACTGVFIMYFSLKLGTVWFVYSDNEFCVFNKGNQIVGGKPLFSYENHLRWFKLAYIDLLDYCQDDIYF